MQTDWQLKSAAEITEHDWLNWQRLVDSEHNGNLVYHRIFVAGLLQYFATDYYLAICTIDNVVRQMCVLQHHRFGIWQLVHPSQATSALIVGKIDTNWQKLFQSLPGIAWRLDFYSLDSEDHKLIVQSSQPKQLTTKSLDISVNLQTNFAEYISRRPKKLKQNVERYMRRFALDGYELDLKVIQKPKDIHDAVCRYAALESAGWKGRQGTALGKNNDQTLFYSDILSALAQQDKVMIAELYGNEKLFASRLCMFNADRFICLKTTYDESQKQYAPGRLLLYKLLALLFSTKSSKTVDFYTNTTAEQIEWSTHARLFYNCSVFRNSVFGWGHRFSHALLKSLRVLIKRTSAP